VLRFCINLGNPLLAQRAGSDVVGVSVEIARALGTRLSQDVTFVVVESARESVETVSSGLADIGFFAFDPMRSNGILFTEPYLEIDGCYMVPMDSSIFDSPEVDRPGVRVVVGAGSAYDLFLSRHLKNAVVVRCPTSPGVVDQYVADCAEVAAGVRQQLESDLRRYPGHRLLPTRFMVIRQAVGVRQTLDGDVRDKANELLREMLNKGEIAVLMEKYRIGG
jgi:polar amino acid transport system substrate-binding protein